MRCETAQEQASLFLDANLEEPAQVVLYRHLEECSECRQFLDSMVRFRKAARTDQEEIFLGASEALPRESPIPSRPRRSAAGAGRWLESLAGIWRIPVPVGVGLALVLIVAGALLGARIAAVTGGPVPVWRAEQTTKPNVVVVCGLPEVEVVGGHR